MRTGRLSTPRLRANTALRLSSALFVCGIFGMFAFTTLALLAPLAIYTVSLALFGLPHVLSELRYVDHRFGRRLDRRLLLPIAVLLPAIVALRTATVFHLLAPALGVTAELGGVALLALCCAQGSAARRTVALVVAGSLGGATALAPYDAAISLAILHNLTPLGFLWQIVPSKKRRFAMFWAVAGFVGLPLLVATGWPRAALLCLFGPAGEIDPLHVGALAAQLYVYVPTPFIATPRAVDFFTASVVAQGAHYAAVLILLPLLLARLDRSARGLVMWPRAAFFVLLCGAAGALSLGAFFSGFAEARALYGIAASVHAWLEIPVLVLALTGPVQPANQSPTRSDPPLAASDTSIARSMRNAAIQAISPPSTRTTASSSAMIDGQ
ncbi:MAG: hypothetical protein ACLQIQ_09315 [Beijerinckiaceae bacterium]